MSSARLRSRLEQRRVLETDTASTLGDELSRHLGGHDRGRDSDVRVEVLERDGAYVCSVHRANPRLSRKPDAVQVRSQVEHVRRLLHGTEFVTGPRATAFVMWA